MKSLHCRLRFAGGSLHPVHRAIVDRESLTRDYLCHWNTAGDGPDTFVYFVEGDRSTFESVLDDTDLVVDYDVAPIGPERFYTYVRQEHRPVDEDVFGAVTRAGAVVVPPVTFEGDGSASLTVLGDATALQRVVDSLPEVVGVDVRRIGRYTGGPGAFDPGLTARQREAVERAVDVGYYATPRTGSVADVAEELDCAPATAAEHLRKAETAIVEALVDSARGP
ncbi:helix-turn-helix domain-containing protein [Halomarina litorea]|uniref:helix-turn-helix domain-containing protein n=1 Tax=Halomarina litorea TaxID=2961595 RepID=UPI0020C1E80F|nr:helix-turn-helix domain-containing protein [Halomarina sp. BCD28]